MMQTMLPKTRFEEGQEVRSLVTAQGLREGQTYTVEAVTVRRTPFGHFTTYFVRGPGGASVSVGNGHLVLTEA